MKREPSALREPAAPWPVRSRPAASAHCSDSAASGARSDCFWQLPGVYITAVGYAGGVTVDPSYDMVCTGRTGHAEVVLVVYDPRRIGYAPAAESVLGIARPDPGHAPGQRHRHAVSLGDLLVRRTATPGRRAVAGRLPEGAARRRPRPITTEIREAPPFYYAEDYHQQYLAKNPDGYCGLAGCGVPFAAAELPATGTAR